MKYSTPSASMLLTALRTRIEWYLGIVLKHPRAAARLQGVKAA